MLPHDETRLRHMLDSAKEAVEFATGTAHLYQILYLLTKKDQ